METSAVSGLAAETVGEILVEARRANLGCSL